MSKILFATMPITGHVNPGLPLARKLVESGHEVRWYTGAKFKSTIESTGATHVSAGRALDFDDSDVDGSFPGRKRLNGLDKLKFDLIEVFTKHIPSSLQDLQALLQEFPATAVVVDTAFATGPMLSELGGPPCVSYGITALPLSSVEVAPFGLGLLPDDTPVGKVRNKILQQISARIIFKDVIDYRNKVRAQFKLPPIDCGLFEEMIRGSALYLQGTVPEFEYRRANMPANVRFVGPMLPVSPPEVSKPSWWQEIVQSDKPVVHVSQGTIATDPDELIVPSIFALADMDVLVVVSSKSLHKVTRNSLPDNVRVADFLPYSEFMQHVDAFVTNGGYGGVHYALAQGVPIVSAGTTEDKLEVGNRVEWSGAGINLRTSKPSTHEIRRAVKKVLTFSRYRNAAKQLSESIRSHDAAGEAAKLISDLAQGSEPVRDSLD